MVKFVYNFEYLIFSRMCCLVLAIESGSYSWLIESGSYSWLIESEIESGLGLSLDCDRVRIVTEFGLWSSRDRTRDWAWLTEPGSWSWWLSLVRDRAWLYLDLGGLYLRFPGSVTSGVWRRRVALSEFVDPSCIHARLLLRCWYSRVTCYPSSVVDITVTLLFSFCLFVWPYLCE